ncbi:DUF7286 family protein [Natrarchaeobius oligotrophus]|uniref:DUF7286 family protein n=1 Tax=Natrarchaeobius oligotrophus TaxID=3455743 RepID=UPI000F523AA5|nr:hypothetical protein [Natrarchaeobius chitinivorans]
MSLDERARIPFALVGVLLLVTSITSVTLLQSRVAPEPTVDASLAMDRTAATTQTVVRNAVADAAAEAAREPLLVADADHPWGVAVANVDETEDPAWTRELPEADDADVDPDRAFERYLKLRIYAAVETDLGHLDGPFREDTTTNVSVPPLEENTTSATDAIDRVRLRPGIDPTNDLEPGQLEVTIENVELTVRRNGREIASRTDDVTVTVGTNVFVLHQLTREYERQLNTGIVEGGLDDPTSVNGLGQQYAARIYPLAWARGIAQWGGAPLSEVIANRHAEVMANDAVFSVQDSVFGTTDPNSRAVMRNAWGCLAAQDAEELYDGQTGDEPAVADAEAFCSGLEYVYGDQNANLDEPVDTADVMESAADAVGTEAGMGSERTISVDEFADLAYAQTLTELDVHDVIDDVHSVETRATLERGTDRTNRPSSRQPSGLRDSSNWTRTRNDLHTETTVDVSVDEDDPDTAERETTYLSATATVRHDHERSLRWSYDGPEDVSSPVTRTRRSASTYETEIEVNARHTDRDAIEYRGIDGGYDEAVDDEWPTSLPDEFFDGDDAWDGLLEDPLPLDTYAQFPDESVERLLAVDPDGDVETQLERQITAPEDVTSERQLRRQLAVADEDRATLETDPPNELIAAAIALDLYFVRTQLQEEADDVTFDDGELLTGDPFGELNEEVDEQLVYYGVSDRYPTAADKARVEARQNYIDNVNGQLETTSETTRLVQDELDDRIDVELGVTDDVDGALEGLTDFTREVAGGRADYQQAEIETPYSDEVEVTPSGSPTYLSLESVEAEEVPATGNATHTPMVARNNNWFAIPYGELDVGILGDVLSWLFDASDDHVLTLRMAGELLEAARLADVLLEEEGEQLVDSDAVYEDLEDAVNQRINNLDGETASRVNEPNNDLNLDEGEIESLINEGINNIGDGTSGQQAAMLGSGDGIDYVEQYVYEEIKVENHGKQPYMNEDIFKQSAAVSVRYALSEAVNESTVDDFDPDYVDYLNESLRDELEERTEEIVAQRVNETIDESDLEHEWLRNNESGMLDEGGEFDLSPNRIPAGMPLVPLPSGWVATTNVWDVEVKGEYARFELESNAGTPTATAGERYVREAGAVSLEGNRLGSTRPISFESQTLVIVVVPPQRLGVGDRTGDWAEESQGWPEAGPEYATN